MENHEFGRGGGITLIRVTHALEEVDAFAVETDELRFNGEGIALAGLGAARMSTYGAGRWPSWAPCDRTR